MMRVTTKTTEQLVIEGAPNLDPITVTIEDYEPGKGKLTVECYGKSWTAYWGAMGSGSTVAEFIGSMDSDYVANCLWRGTDKQQTRVDWDAMPQKVRAEICKLRRNGDLRKSEARVYFEQAMYCTSYQGADSALMVTVFGDDWHVCLPESPHPEWTYLQRIVDAVRAGVAVQPEPTAEQFADVVARITAWRDLKAVFVAQLDALTEVTAMAPEAPLRCAVFELWEAHTKLLAEQIGATHNWLEWYDLECQMGDRPMEASSRNDTPMLPVETPEDLARLILGMAPA